MAQLFELKKIIKIVVCQINCLFQIFRQFGLWQITSNSFVKFFIYFEFSNNYN